MKYFKPMLLTFAWIICVIWLYIGVANFAAFLNAVQKISTSTIYGILIVSLIASLISFVGLSITTFYKSLLQENSGFKKILIIGACMFPMANLIELAGSNFQLTRYFWASFAVSICVSFIIILAMVISWRK